MTLFLTPEQIAFFDSQGYLIVEDVLDQTTLAAVKSEYSALLDQMYDRWHADGQVPPAGTQDFFEKLLTGYKAGCEWFQPMDISLPGSKIEADTPFHCGPAVFDMLTNARLLDMVEDLLGPELTSTPIQHVRLKPPSNILRDTETTAHIMATDWHQDRAVAHAEGDATQIVTVWLAMMDATPENGCLKVIPGKPHMYPHCPKRQTAIADGFIDEADAIPLPVKAGGAVLFHPLTPHASLDNTSGVFRWSFDIRYNVTGQPTGRAHFPEFIARSRATPETELRDWRAWQDSWIQTRATLAPQDHIPIHRWTHDAPACA
ncbi:phytanoyl-CoA dioxygenase family protein [Pacificoceanicola onchidii]|uniref:phytanoyl-CoA dioxygenase family protein n=1 Tax=Pacificoceanicola onchidii TaxID=2562685 RepID=UPI0010A4E6F1|nr:phytanoyl-CoA dioxygenase family protein [Pacificoceanicola onchidii]